MLEVDKNTALRWADQVHEANTRFITESHADSLVNISVMFANQTAHLLRGLRAMLPDDPATAAALQESAAQGIVYGVVTALMLSDAARYELPGRKALS